jgi:hypothetical protein
MPRVQRTFRFSRNFAALIDAHRPQVQLIRFAPVIPELVADPAIVRLDPGWRCCAERDCDADITALTVAIVGLV